MNVGTEWLVDAEGCSAELLRDIEAVRGVCEEVVADLGLRVVGEPMWHQFPQPGGVTGLYLLTESHLACHTFPETGLATFNLYCCRPRPRFAWEERLRALLGASRVTVRTAARGEAAAGHGLIEASDHEPVEGRDLAKGSKSGNQGSFEMEFPDSTSAREVSGL
ncbi:MAG: S-adenosylmethionine decarboxylase [Acidobacteriota bacterium]